MYRHNIHAALMHYIVLVVTKQLWLRGHHYERLVGHPRLLLVALEDPLRSHKRQAAVILQGLQIVFT